MRKCVLCIAQRGIVLKSQKTGGGNTYDVSCAHPGRRNNEARNRKHLNTAPMQGRKRCALRRKSAWLCYSVCVLLLYSFLSKKSLVSVRVRNVLVLPLRPVHHRSQRDERRARLQSHLSHLAHNLSHPPPRPSAPKTNKNTDRNRS